MCELNRTYHILATSGDLTGLTTPQTLNMMAPKSVTASFGPDFVLSAVPPQTVGLGTASTLWRPLLG